MVQYQSPQCFVGVIQGQFTATHLIDFRYRQPGGKAPSPFPEVFNDSLFHIEFVIDFANELLNDVLHGEDARGSSKLIDHDGEVVFQSERFEWYRAAISTLADDGLVYRCFCTRREIREAASAPHGEALADGAYPGTCRELSTARQMQFEREGRRSALRLRTNGERYRVDDRIAGVYEGGVDDVVLERNDGVPAYNLAVVVDDHLQGVTQVVRGDDLLSSTPRQMHLQRLLGYQHPEYAHVPLVLGPDGSRLAKRHGAVTLADLAAQGVGPADVVAVLAASLGLDPAEGSDPRSTTADLLADFSFDSVVRVPWQPHPWQPHLG